MINISRSLCDILGENYCEAVNEVSSYTMGIDSDKSAEKARDKVPFLTEHFLDKQNELAGMIGEAPFAGLSYHNEGAPTDSFRKAFKENMTPLGGLGAFRIGEDGKVYLAAKSEHYHTPLGHQSSVNRPPACRLG